MNSPLKPLRRAAAAMAGVSHKFREHVAQGDVARDAGDWDAAIEHYGAALKSGAQDLGIGVQLGHCLKEAGRYAEAEGYYRAYLAAHPADADIHLQLGHLQTKQGREADARPWYEKALTLAPAEGQIAADARLGLGLAVASGGRSAALALVDRGRFEEAHGRLVDLVNAGAEDLSGILGNVCKELGRFAEAHAWYARRAALPDGASPDVAFDLEVQLGHLGKAEGDYAAALGRFVAATRKLPAARNPTCSEDELEGEINACLSQVTTSILLL
jgi:tetratricopeptide (TPR) repeat protein